MQRENREIMKAIVFMIVVGLIVYVLAMWLG
jgi:hypothetical protein